MAASGVSAESCGGVYTVQRGDSLSQIADRLYQDAGKWTAIHTTNIDTIGSNPNAIRVGQKLQLTCIAGLPTGLPGGAPVLAEAATPAPEDAVTRTAPDLLGTPELPKIRLVTGNDFAPFTDRGLENGGLLAEVVTAAMDAAVGPDGHDTFWVNDWGSHIDQMLPAGLMEMAYPWAKPDCDNFPNEGRCATFHYSDAMFEYLILLFVDQQSPIPFATDSDIEGRTICRPEAYTTHMLDENGRNWLKDGKITLKQPTDPADCFTMLVNGEVEGVVLNEFTARDAIFSLGLQDRVEAVQSRPVSITGLHVMIHKANPLAEELVATINNGLAAIKQAGQYQQIVARHMSTVWSKY
jgi:polar amino acid transport system substrate-binding protein